MTTTTDHSIPHWEMDFYEGVLPKRLIAWFIDVGVTAVMTAPLALPVLAVGTFLIFPLLLIPVIWAVVGFAYRWATISNRSATWGMRLMAIELRDDQGQHLSGSTAFMHVLGSTLSFGFPLIQTVSMIAMMITPRGQGLVDVVLGTSMQNKSS